MSKVWVLQHIHCETLGTIADALAAADLSWQYIRPFKGESIPKEMDDAAALIVMGGPMSVYDHLQHPFIPAEIRLIEHALHQEKPVLGVCLGSQLLAAALGASVRKGAKMEIGWHPITLLEEAKTDKIWAGVESPFMAHHWHGDVFDLPQGAVPLASSELTSCQAFRFGQSAYGFLFHMEVTTGIIKEMVDTFADELKQEKIEGREIIERSKDYLPALQEVGGLVFKKWTSLVRG